MLRKIFKHTKAQKIEQQRAEVQKALLHYEARLGGEIFGPVPKDHRREFFCLDEHTWVWHEEWLDQNGKHQSLTTRYDVRPNGVVKSQGSNVYQALSKQEAQNLYKAVQVYQQRVGAELKKIAGQTA